jgi:6-phosphogluconolactonase
MADPYPLSTTNLPRAPRLPGEVVVRADADALLDAALAELMVRALSCVRTLGDFHLALSGGSTPIPMYRRLMYDPSYREFPWRKTHLWIVDERRVGFDDDLSNYKHIEELIVRHSDIPSQQVHPMRATEADADTRYERELREALEWRERGQDRLDYVLLGMGGDAHTASLFPHSPALVEPAPGRLVRINEGPRVTPPDRVTLTLEMINASRCVGVLVTGAGKRQTLARVSDAYAQERDGPDAASVAEMPILGVRPRAGELRWYLDSEACPRVGGEA